MCLPKLQRLQSPKLHFLSLQIGIRSHQYSALLNKFWRRLSGGGQFLMPVGSFCNIRLWEVLRLLLSPQCASLLIVQWQVQQGGYKSDKASLWFLGHRTRLCAPEHTQLSSGNIQNSHLPGIPQRVIASQAHQACKQLGITPKAKTESLFSGLKSTQSTTLNPFWLKCSEFYFMHGNLMSENS